MVAVAGHGHPWHDRCAFRWHVCGTRGRVREERRSAPAALLGFCRSLLLLLRFILWEGQIRCRCEVRIDFESVLEDFIQELVGLVVVFGEELLLQSCSYLSLWVLVDSFFEGAFLLGVER